MMILMSDIKRTETVPSGTVSFDWISISLLFRLIEYELYFLSLRCCIFQRCH